MGIEPKLLSQPARYAIFEPYLRKYTSPIGNDEFSGYAEGIINLPLLHEPGERWRYGVCLAQLTSEVETDDH